MVSNYAVATPLNYAPAPPDNPLRGLVPYVSSSGRAQFPHSMEFRYFSLRDVMKGPDVFDWTIIEKTLVEVNGRGNQLIFRIYCEYPGKELAIPQFLIDTGVKVMKWTNSSNGHVSHTPDYSDKTFQKALGSFITAMGNKYDGDSRIAFITAGLLGSWGEWHTYPRSDLRASKQVQREVMESYAKAFSKTKVLLRYPAGLKDDQYAENHERPFGYHDDSFCWATLETGKEDDSWYFESSMKRAGAKDKWKDYPMGGEIRPELWSHSFTTNRHPRDQGFVACVERMHTTWLLDSGLFDVRIQIDEKRKATALRETARLGYEFYVSSADWQEGMISLTVENRGVAPFYYDWPIEIKVDGEIVITDWKMSGLLPGEIRKWSMEWPKKKTIQIRVPNPMKKGKPLRFANQNQGKEWLVINP